MKYETSGAGKEAEDGDIIKIINALVKQHQESIEIYEKNSRADLLAIEVLELSVLKSLLPAELSEAELFKLIDQAIAQTGATSAKEMGAVVKAVKEKIAELGQNVDGRALADGVKKKLSS